MKKKSIAYLIEASLAIQSVSAWDAEKVGFYSRLLADTCFPTRNPMNSEFVRRNGHVQLTILSPSNIGLPYGTYPRLILIWVVTQATIKKSRQIFLGENLAEFIRNLGKQGSGGKTGSITALREQTKRLFASTICVTKEGVDSWSVKNVSIVAEAAILWNSSAEWSSHLLLNNDFYRELIGTAYPIDLRVVDAFSHYPFALDIYLWLTSRYFRMYKPTLISWLQLEDQFGNSFANSRHFHEKFKSAIGKVTLLYPEARYSFKSVGLMLYPSPPHVPNTNLIPFDKYG